MEKAYDVKDLGMRLKSRGLDVAEEAGMVVVEEVAAWVKESAALSKNPYDDILAVVMPKLEEAAKEAVDKIDGKEG